jgi:nucleotide-binding universal stress UspA family protein
MNLPDIQIKKILYATDLSESAVHAFAYAVSLANLYGAGITILHVLAEYPGEEFITNMISADTWEAIKQRNFAGARDQLIGKRRGQTALKQALEAFSEEAQAGDEQTFVTDEILIESGHPAEVIVESAKKQNCDLIVMGTHGQSALAEVLIGSTARWVVRHSPIPVLVIRLP